MKHNVKAMIGLNELYPTISEVSIFRKIPVWIVGCIF